jgi:antitoxin HicB
MRYVFPARLEAHDRETLVSFRDLPEALTSGRNRDEALRESIDVLDAALLFRLKEGRDIPEPSATRRGEVGIAASPGIAAKIAFARAFSESALSRVALAKRLGTSETEIRRMLDPGHATKIDRLNAALRALGRRLVLGDEKADAA